VGLAALAGAGIGTYIGNNIDGTPVGGAIGSVVSNVLAALGFTDAKNAVESNFYANASADDKGKMRAGYLMKSYAEKAQYAKDHPALAEQIKSSLVAQRADETSDAVKYYASHSRIYGNDTDALFSQVDKTNNLPSGTTKAYFQQESSGGKNLLSVKGAKGPFQFVDRTAEEFGLHGNDVYDLDKSAIAAGRKIAGLRKLYGGNADLAAAGYNSGEGNVAKYGGIPPFAETQNYVKSIRQLTAQNQGGNTSTAEVNIQSLQVNAPNATDANGIASGIQAAFQRNQLISQATTGTQ
jgi:soluble lytic murein transglycosylase-like protein